MNKISNMCGLTALILGITSLVSFLAPYLGLPLSILAIIFAGKQKPNTKNAQAGLILGIIGLVLNGVMSLFLLLILIITPELMLVIM